jgi:hypothetical protein
MIRRAGVIVFDGRVIAVLLPSRVIVAVTFFYYHLRRRGCSRGRQTLAPGPVDNRLISETDQRVRT